MADSSNGTATITTINSNPTMNPFSSMTTVVNIKLDRTNYLSWLAQILPILKSCDMMAGKPVDNELVHIIFNNMGLAYAIIVNAAQTRDTPIMYLTLEALLLTTERRMTEKTAPLMEAAPVNAFVTVRGRGGRLCGNGRGMFPVSFQFPQQQLQ
ncbi:hypothetical protein D8674_031044 [Pyrus ussuriensis x Pyrus communis]|uniref:Retrotransposon Copia-like N-terminal domain-containing protein n=1 Tax=Pyrus ussuriensis x Pyrus communis TaxID=2448454 RepID=A0A5N5FAQ9_9ROSA|nr:hypothetical protein D8674_031044 [Pyrus ussuriensis x Pyrus communis]